MNATANQVTLLPEARKRQFLPVTRLGLRLVLPLLAVVVVTPTYSQTPDEFDPVFSSMWSVDAVGVQGDGKVVVGGHFTMRSGPSRTSICRLHTDGTLDTAFDPALVGLYGGTWDPEVYSIALQADGKIVVGGCFYRMCGQVRYSVGRLNPDGTLDNGFAPTPGGVSPWVHCMAVQADGKILMGGSFTSMSGQSRSCIARVKTDGTLDTSFYPTVTDINSPWVRTIALQADGKILVGGAFTTLGGQNRSNLGRLNANGTLDTTFSAGADGYSPRVYSLAVQADGKIVVGGTFTVLGGQSCTNIGRLNSDGSVDLAFHPGPEWNKVSSLAVQADGKILVGGWFPELGGQSRENIGRLNSDGSVDLSFNPGASSYVNCLAIQPDGKILAGGEFRALGGQNRSLMGRLYNTESASQALIFDATSITWFRGATSPEVWRTTFESSSDGTNWVSLGTGTRISGGWQLTGLALPTNITIRARGFIVGNGPSCFVESIAPPATPAILVNDGRLGVRSNRFGFSLSGSAGSVVVVESSTTLSNWMPLSTNMLPSGPIYYSDPSSTSSARQFYRARLH